MIPLLSVLLICISSVSSYQTLTLPSDFDLSHPALNYAAHDELLQTNPNAVLPQLPSEILALARTVEEDEASTQVDTVNCETYSGSPKREDGIYAGNRLESIPYPFVCHVFPGTYTVIWTGGWVC